MGPISLWVKGWVIKKCSIGLLWDEYLGLLGLPKYSSHKNWIKPSVEHLHYISPLYSKTYSASEQEFCLINLCIPINVCKIEFFVLCSWNYILSCYMVHSGRKHSLIFLKEIKTNFEETNFLKTILKTCQGEENCWGTLQIYK